MRFIDVDRFDGGLVDSSIDIGDESINMIRYGQNIRTRGGAIKDRDGMTEYCDFHLAVGIMGNDIGPIYEYRREAGEIYYAIVFSVGDDYYYVEADDPNVAVAIATLSNGNFYALNYYDHLWIANGEDVLKVWDGQNLYNAGIVGPTLAPVGVAVAGTIPAGYRKYKYTYYRDADPYDKESPASPELTMDLSAGSKSTNLTFVSSVDPQVTHIYLYATDTYADPLIPATEFNLLAVITAGTTTYNDNATTFIGAAYDTTDRGNPGVFSGIFETDNRIYGWSPDDPSIIEYSEIGKPFYWGANNWDEVNRDDGDKITNVGAIGLVKFIFKQNSIYQWSGDPSIASPIIPVERPDATNNMVRLGIGCQYPRTLVGWSNSLIFMTSDSQIYMLTINDLIHLSEYVQENIKLLTAGGGSPRCVIHNDYLIVSSGSRSMVCDLRRGKTGWEGFDVYDESRYPDNWLVDHNGYCLGSYGDRIFRYYDSSVKTDVGEEPIKIVQPFYYKASNNISEAIFRRVLANCQYRTEDFTMSIYVDGSGFTSLVDNFYTATDRWFGIPSGCRGHYLSARLQWTETDVIINSISYGFLLGARH